MNDLVFKDPNEKTPCPECKGTGKVMLFTGISDCKMCKPKQEHVIVYDFVVDSDSKKAQASAVRFYTTARGTAQHAMFIGRERAFYRRLFGGE